MAPLSRSGDNYKTLWLYHQFTIILPWPKGSQFFHLFSPQNDLCSNMHDFIQGGSPWLRSAPGHVRASWSQPLSSDKWDTSIISIDQWEARASGPLSPLTAYFGQNSSPAPPQAAAEPRHNHHNIHWSKLSPHASSHKPDCTLHLA